MNESRSLKSLTKFRFRATLLGGAIGDALGFPYEGSSPSYLMALGDKLVAGFEKHRSGYFPAGQYSDDTQMTLATVEAIVEAGELEGARVADAFVPLWRENRIVGRDEACTAAIQRLMDGTADWRTSGAEAGCATNGAAMRAAPIGLWDYDNQESITEHSRAIGGITHQDPRALAGAAGVAAAVAYNVTHREIVLGDFVDAIAAAAGPLDSEFAQVVGELPRLLSLPEETAQEEILCIGSAGATTDPREGVAQHVVPSVLLALYSFLRSPTDYLPTVHRCLMAGGDVDTTASIAGAISGALNGDDALPADLLEALPRAQRIIDLADSLYALKEEQRARV